MGCDVMKSRIAGLALIAAALLPDPATAQQFEPVREQAAFVEVVTGRQLTRFGIQLQVTPAGEIRGRAFGRPVTGAWLWRDGYFCRDLFWGERDLGPNCQEVRIDGDTVRFISDRGDGIYADLRLQ
jgi:hypothetical protein